MAATHGEASSVLLPVLAKSHSQVAWSVARATATMCQKKQVTTFDASASVVHGAFNLVSQESGRTALANWGWID